MPLHLFRVSFFYATIYPHFKEHRLFLFVLNGSIRLHALAWRHVLSQFHCPSLILRFKVNSSFCHSLLHTAFYYLYLPFIMCTHLYVTTHIRYIKIHISNNLLYCILPLYNMTLHIILMLHIWMTHTIIECPHKLCVLPKATWLQKNKLPIWRVRWHCGEGTENRCHCPL